MSEPINWAEDGDFFYPSDDVMQGLDEINSYLKSSRLERYFFKQIKENMPADDYFDKKFAVGLAFASTLGGFAISTIIIGAVAEHFH